MVLPQVKERKGLSPPVRLLALMAMTAVAQQWMGEEERGRSWGPRSRNSISRFKRRNPSNTSPLTASGSSTESHSRDITCMDFGSKVKTWPPV